MVMMGRVLNILARALKDSCRCVRIYCSPEQCADPLSQQLVDDNPFVYPSEEKMNRQHQDGNMALVYCTTPSNVFHVLRRQVHRDFRKPLIMFFSKSLLRHPEARSTLDEFLPGTGFRRFIPDDGSSIGNPEDVKRLILCSGQQYFALTKYRKEHDLKDVAISRCEQLAPVPFDDIRAELDRFPNADICWSQEEPCNGGAWGYMQPRLRTICRHSEHHKDSLVMLASRPPYASVATGNKQVSH
jgi:2-oxoglutarate dehydrogenase E1 component